MLETSENHLRPSLDYMMGDLLANQTVFISGRPSCNKLYLGYLKGIKV
jgi:hypothetical protein